MEKSVFGTWHGRTPSRVRTVVLGRVLRSAKKRYRMECDLGNGNRWAAEVRETGLFIHRDCKVC